MYLCRYRRRTYLSWMCIALVLISTVWLFWYCAVHDITSEVSCSSLAGRKYIADLCLKYHKGEIPGSLCTPLCARKEIFLQACLGHTDGHILSTNWSGVPVVLKVDTNLKDTISRHFSGDYYLSDKHSKAYSMNQFIHLLNLSLIQNILGAQWVPSATVLEAFTNSCDRNQDNALSYTEALYCWHLADNQEYMLSILLQGIPAIPKPLGFCGPVFAQEYASSKPLLELSFPRDPRSWQFRAKLAIALIEMVEQLESTRYGTLYLCDVKEPNFGFVEEQKYIAKAIDLDMSWFKSTLLESIKREEPIPCVDDYDCEFSHCIFQCNNITNKCSGKLYSNNLQVLCQRLFMSRHAFHSALLANPSKNIAKALTQLLQQCAFPGIPTVDINSSLAQSLKQILRSTL